MRRGVDATLVRYLLAHLGLGPHSRILEIGCGTGAASRVAAESYSCRVTGIDINPDLASRLASLTVRVGRSHLVSFAVASGRALPFRDGAFDRVIMVGPALHIDDTAAVFAEARRVLEPRGLLGLSDHLRVGAGAGTCPSPAADDTADDDDASSPVSAIAEFAALLGATGFALEHTGSPINGEPLAPVVVIARAV